MYVYGRIVSVWRRPTILKAVLVFSISICDHYCVQFDECPNPRDTEVLFPKAGSVFKEKKDLLKYIKHIRYELCNPDSLIPNIVCSQGLFPSWARRIC